MTPRRSPAPWEYRFLAGEIAGYPGITDDHSTRESALRAAYHEAGHVVANELLEIERLSVSIRDVGDGTAGRGRAAIPEDPPSANLAHRLLVSYFAGAAVDALRGVSSSTRCTSDFRQARAITAIFANAGGGSAEDLAERGMTRACELLSAEGPWRAVAGVARELIEFGNARGPRISEVIAAPDLGGRPRGADPLSEFYREEEARHRREYDEGVRQLQKRLEGRRVAAASDDRPLWHQHPGVFA